MDQFNIGIPRCHIPDESHHPCQGGGLKIKIFMVGKGKCIRWLCACQCSPDGQILGIYGI